MMAGELAMAWPWPMAGWPGLIIALSALQRCRRAPYRRSSPLHVVQQTAPGDAAAWLLWCTTAVQATDAAAAAAARCRHGHGLQRLARAVGARRAACREQRWLPTWHVRAVRQRARMPGVPARPRRLRFRRRNGLRAVPARNLRRRARLCGGGMHPLSSGSRRPSR
eukprot:COSAG01_NODE_16_length_40091_cov_15.728646_38_plen_166_part_00